MVGGQARLRRPTLTRYLALLLCLLIVACGSDNGSSPAATDTTAPAETSPTEAAGDASTLTLIDGSGGEHQLSIETADTADERSVGLSNRRSLDPDAGMFFVFENRGLGFWMKDTYIPLSVAFIARCGEIVEIADMEPESLDLHQADANYAFGLEVNQGWFAANDIEIGDRVVIPAAYHDLSCP